MIDDDDATAARRAARKQAMDLLARREHAPAELIRKLGRRGHERAVVESVIDALVDDGLLSTARYADAMVAARAARGAGPLRVRAELVAVDVPDAEIERALADANVDWAALAASVRVKRYGAEAPADFPDKARQMRFLQQRGFGPDDIVRAFEAERD